MTASPVVQTTDQTITSNTTLQNTELIFAVAANEVWQFEGLLFYESSSAPDIKFQATGPSGAIGRFGIDAAYQSTINALSRDIGVSLALGFSGLHFPVARFWGAIKNDATAGNLTIQFAQATSDPANTTFHAGSYIQFVEAGSSGGSCPTAGEVADVVWDEAQAGHVAAGSFGEIATEIASVLSTVSVLPSATANADAVWDEAQSGHVAAGSFGEIATEIATLLTNVAAVPADVLAEAYEGTETVQDFYRLARAALMGILAGAATTSVTIRDRANTKDRITATVDADGNRTAVTVDAS